MDNYQKIVKEVQEWRLDKKGYEQVSDLLLIIREASSSFENEVKNNRNFCSVCSLKHLSEKSLFMDEVLGFIFTIQNIKKNKIYPREDIVYILKELYFFTYMISEMNILGVDFIKSHMLDYITLQKKEFLGNKDLLESITNLRIFFLSFNAILAELFESALLIINQKLSSVIKEDSKRVPILIFIFGILLKFLNGVQIIHFEKEKMIGVKLQKFSIEKFTNFDTVDSLNLQYKI
jgi:ribosomal protein S19